MSDHDEDEVCPLCCEEFDLSDKNFIPCPCGYRVRLQKFRIAKQQMEKTKVELNVLL